MKTIAKISLGLMVYTLLTLAIAQSSGMRQLSIGPVVTTVVTNTGDSLGSIAHAYLILPSKPYWEQVAKLNNLRDPYVIQPGMTIKLPTQLLASQQADVMVLSVMGNVTVSHEGGRSQAVKVADKLRERDQLAVPKDASVKLKLADGTVVTVLADSVVSIAEHRYLSGNVPLATTSDKGERTNAFVGMLRLVQGSLETVAKKASDRASPLRIQTPTSVVGVRGTVFRVTHDAAIAQSTVTTRAEVLEGGVQAQLDERRRVDVKGGFGVRLDAAQQAMPQVVSLLEAPDVSHWNLSQGRPVLELAALPNQMAGRIVTGYRFQAQAANAAADVVVDKRFAAGELIRIPGLQDASYRLLVRAIDEQGLEGRNAEVTLTLKARPEPPILEKPLQAAKLVQFENVHLMWADYSAGSGGRASGYLLEITNPVGERVVQAVTESSTLLKGLTLGQYTWRIATQRSGQNQQLDTGPWSDKQTFTVVAPPESPVATLDNVPAGQNRSLAFRWADQKAASYEVHIAKVPNFDNGKALVLSAKTQAPNLMLINPETGTYFVRYRAIEKDGFVGGWSGTMQVDVPKDWRHLLLYLGGAVTKWP